MEKVNSSLWWKIILAVAVIAIVGIGTALVQENKNKRFNNDDAPDQEFVWTAPSTGTPVHHYVAQVLINDLDTLFFDPVPTEDMLVDVTYGNKYRMRVAGVDAANIQGPWSMWSRSVTPEIDPPGF